MLSLEETLGSLLASSLRPRASADFAARDLGGAIVRCRGKVPVREQPDWLGTAATSHRRRDRIGFDVVLSARETAESTRGIHHRALKPVILSSSALILARPITGGCQRCIQRVNRRTIRNRDPLRELVTAARDAYPLWPISESW